jgi:hypothetical protein
MIRLHLDVRCQQRTHACRQCRIAGRRIADIEQRRRKTAPYGATG